MTDLALDTPTVADQRSLEEEVAAIYKPLVGMTPMDRLDALVLQRKLHAKYLRDGLSHLPASFACLEASRVWITYWMSHGLALLGCDLDADRAADIVDFLRRCQHPQGGFGGGPGQLAHVAPTYAALATLATLEHPDALAIIDRPALWSFLTRMALPPERGGGFSVHEGGEADLRACYCATAAAVLAGLDAQELARRAGLVQYVQRCQTFEGGLGGEPGNEAHGGYTYCGLAALTLVGEAGQLDLRALAHWAVHMQGSLEGGFRGRTNKLVDGCYSFWQGAVFPLLRLSGIHPLALPSLTPSPALARHYADPARLSKDVRLLLDFNPQLLQGASPVDRAHAQLRAAVDASPEISPETEALMDDVERLQCAVHRLFHEAFVEDASEPELFSGTALQAWLLACSQVRRRGGLRDKPGKNPDYYHTCYCLSGLAVAQEYSGLVLGPATDSSEELEEGEDEGSVGAEAANELRRTDPRLNVCRAKLARALQRWEREGAPKAYD